MTITLQTDVTEIVGKTAEDYGITLEQAANFLIRLSTLEKPIPALCEMLIRDTNGNLCYRYPLQALGFYKNAFRP